MSSKNNKSCALCGCHVSLAAPLIPSASMLQDYRNDLELNINQSLSSIDLCILRRQAMSAHNCFSNNALKLKGLPPSYKEKGHSTSCQIHNKRAHIISVLYSVPSRPKRNESTLQQALPENVRIMKQIIFLLLPFVLAIFLRQQASAGDDLDIISYVAKHPRAASPACGSDGETCNSSCTLKCGKAVTTSTIIASSQSSHVAYVLPEDICVKRSLADRLHSLPLATFPNSSEFHLTVVTGLDRVIQETYDNQRMRESDVRQRRRVLSDLQHHMSGRNVTLEAFGSCCHGFGTIASDLDVQVTGNVTRSEIIQLLPKEFCVHYISERKPLVVLKHSPTGIMVDMMLNPLHRNRIALSIWLLQKYSRFDPRVQVLGVFLRTLVKKLKISETKYGDPGSSVYITMLMHYLQQTNPPVLPEINKRNSKTETFVQRNNATVGQLWLGFLRYYVHEFNYEEDVICLFQVRCKTRKEKGWHGPDHNMIAIEATSGEEIDEGSRLSPLMSDYILRVFNQLQFFYLKDIYDGLLRRNDINLDYHPRYGHKTHLVVDTWGHHNRTACEVMGREWILSLVQ